MRSRWERPGVAAAVAVAVGWTVAACGGADQAGAGTPVGTPVVGRSTPVVGGGGSGTPGGGGTPVNSASAGGSGGTRVPGPSTAPGGTGTCATDQLSVALGAPDSAKFEEDVLLVFTNTAGRPCSLSGFVKLQLRGPSAAMATTVTPQPGASAVVILNPGQRASTRLLWNKYEGQGGTCPPFPVSIAVTPPGGQTARTIPWLPGDDGSVCGGGAIRVYPVVAGAQGS